MTQPKGGISETRIRKAAEELVQYFHGASTSKQASMAGEDMREWQVGTERVIRAAKKAAKKMK